MAAITPRGTRIDALLRHRVDSDAESQYTNPADETQTSLLAGNEGESHIHFQIRRPPRAALTQRKGPYGRKDPNPQLQEDLCIPRRFPVSSDLITDHQSSIGEHFFKCLYKAHKADA